jgi:hypothetical protein
VKQADVQYGVELLAKISQTECVPNHKSRRKIAFACLELRTIDRRRHGIDARRIQASRSRQQRVLTRSASHIQHSAGQQTLIS